MIENTFSEFPERVFITGIGTDVGKSYATGWLARRLGEAGRNVITQKFVQTGCQDQSEDILTHREIMGIQLTESDFDHTTAPIILSYPASPDLAARIDGVTVDFEKATRSTDELLRRGYDCVLIEGAGGLLVPLCGDYLTADYVANHHLPLVLVTNGQLGSVSNTLLSLESIARRGLRIHAMVYNPHFDSDKTIAADSRKYLQNYLKNNFPEALWIEMSD